MKIKRIVIENVKSFKEKTEIEFNENLNIFIGPNGGGKSNLLDILTICLNNYFSKHYSVEKHDVTSEKKINSRDASEKEIRSSLDKYFGYENSEMNIKFEFLVTKTDIENIKLIVSESENLQNVLNKYQNAHEYKNILEDIKKWNYEDFEKNETLSFNISEYRLEEHNEHTKDKQNKHKTFLDYLKYLKFILILATDLPDIKQKIFRNYLYFGPYRNHSGQKLEVDLTTHPYNEVYLSNTTSKTPPRTFIPYFTRYFGMKRRIFEKESTDKGYKDLWEQDEEVIQVTDVLKKLGYEWDLELVDANRNLYTITIYKNNKEFDINNASSGEKEIINFVTAIYTFNISNGIIIIDEPELHLYPKLQRFLLNLFIELSESKNIQFIFSTHSPIFITDKSYNYVYRIFQDSENVSRCVAFQQSSNDKDTNENEEKNARLYKEILHIIHSTNNEKIFFADVAILVEGITDKLIFQNILDEQLSQIQTTRIVEIVAINGKSSYKMFKKFLTKIKLDHYLIADSDYEKKN